MIKKRILLLGGYYFPDPTGIGKYNDEFINWLSSHGYECGVVTTYPFYPYWKIQEPYVGKSYWFKKERHVLSGQNPITVYRCPHYVPEVPTGMKRVLSDLSLFLSAFFQVVRLLFRKKYDIVITVAPPFQLGLIGYMYKKLRRAKSVYHIQDLQVDAAKDLGMLKSKFMLNLMFGIERFILKKSDFISTISEGMVNKLKSKQQKDVLLFPNWADTKLFHPLESNLMMRQEFGFSKNDKIVLYSGAIGGKKQGLQTLLASAKDLELKTEIKFIICSSGPYKQRLIDLAVKLELKNVFFVPLQEKKNFNAFLNMADIHLVLQKANTNDLMMPSKLTTILAIGGLVLVTAPQNSSLYNLIDKYKMGILVDPENQADLTDAIRKSVDDNHPVTRINACVFASEYLSIDRVIGKFMDEISEAKKVSPAIPKKQKEQFKMDVAS